MKKRVVNPSKYIIISVVLIFILLVIGLLSLGPFLDKVAAQVKTVIKAKTPTSEVDIALSPIPDKTYVTTAKLLRPRFASGVHVRNELKSYLTSFTAGKYDEAVHKIISFQGEINPFDLSTLLEIDTALADSIAKAAGTVKLAKDFSTERKSCEAFNGLLNPSLLIMDLTLWSGKSELYLALQQNRDVGMQCLFYYPQLSHGMVTYDVRTGRIVQRSAFCDPSETKSKCFGVWDYFWKFAVDPREGPINYGVGCSLTDWMNQGFICTHGVDIRNNTMMMNTIFSLDGTALLHIDVKDEFQNALGASGKMIIDNVKQKCAKVKEKSSKYGSIVPALTGAGSSLTGGVISTATAATGTGEGLKEEYEKAMLFASLFSEACTANPSDLAKDLAGGGGAGQFGLNKPNACILSDVKEVSSNGLQAEKACLDHFFGPRGLEQVQNLDGLPDNWCMPSASQSGSQCTDISCLLPGGDKGCGSDGTKCGREPTKQEEQYLKNAGAGAVGEKWRVVDTRKEIDEICGRKLGASAAACSSQSTKTAYVLKENIKASPKDPTTAPSPKGGGKVYTFQALVKHEQNHITKDDPKKSVDENDQVRKEEDKKNSKNFVNPPKGEPAPDGLEPDECSAQAQKVNAFADCLDKSQLKNIEQPNGLAPARGGSAPDPAPPGEEVGGTTVPKCDETSKSGGAGGYFGTKENSADDCIIGDFCDFGGSVLGGRMGTPKICQQVESTGEGKEPPCPGLGND